MITGHLGVAAAARGRWPRIALPWLLVVSIAPDLSPIQNLLGADRDTVVKVLKSWGPGHYDAELDKDR